MDVLRTLVSGRRRRYRDEHFDLDLTYITSRLIAMGLPAHGLEAAYRNNADEVARFLRLHHGGNFMIFNLSERPYNYGLFEGRVIDCGWPDHHTAPLHWLVDIAKAIDGWLASSPEHVAVVHCLAGKGRTGVAIASYLLYSGAVLRPDWDAALHEEGERLELPALLQQVYDAVDDGDGDEEPSSADGGAGGDDEDEEDSKSTPSDSTSVEAALPAQQARPSAGGAGEVAEDASGTSGGVKGWYLELRPGQDVSAQVPPAAELGARAILAFVRSRGDGLNFAAQRRSVRHMALLVREALVGSLEEAAGQLRQAFASMPSGAGGGMGGSSAAAAAAAAAVAEPDTPISTSSASAAGSSAESPLPEAAGGAGSAAGGGEGASGKPASEGTTAAAAADPEPEPEKEAGEAEAEAGESASASVTPRAGSSASVLPPPLRLEYGLALRALADLHVPPAPTLLIYTIVLHGVPGVKDVDSPSNGCTPSIQLRSLPYQGSGGEEAVFDSAWGAAAGNGGVLPSYTREDTAVVIPMNASVKGDVLLRCLHHRPGSSGKPPKELFRYTFHTAFMSEGQSSGDKIHRAFAGELDMDKRKRHRRRLPGGFHMDILYDRAGLHEQPASGHETASGLVAGKVGDGSTRAGAVGGAGQGAAAGSSSSTAASGQPEWRGDDSVVPEQEVAIAVGQLQMGGASV